MARYQVGTITLDDELISDRDDCICDGPCIMDESEEVVYDLDDREPQNTMYEW